MRAAVYRGAGDVRIEEVSLPAPGPGEVVLQVEACGVCGTDLKKIVHGDLPPPLIFGHEVAGRVAAVGKGIQRFKPGDRVLFFHHIPCRNCSFCRDKTYAQCSQYKKVGTTAGFDPAGGGFAEYVKIMDWITQEGLVKIPDGVESEEATFVEPVNTCLKGIRKAGITADKSVLIFGAGPVGLIVLQLARLTGASTFVTDIIPQRLHTAAALGATDTFPINSEKNLTDWVRQRIDPHGVDIGLVAASSTRAIEQALEAVRPAGRVVLFAQTRMGELASLDTGQIGKLEKELIGSYSASIDHQEEAADLVFRRKIQIKPLITHRFPLEQIHQALEVALHPSATSLKVMIHPNGNGLTQ